MSKRDVYRAYCRMCKAAREAGLNARGWSYQPGSTSNGISWALMAGRGGGSDLVGPPPFDHIGKTGREAEAFLAGMAAAFESVAYAERRKGERS